LANFGYNFMNLNHVWKKVGRGRSHNLFSFNVFLNLHAICGGDIKKYRY
jgi:hypothetical protein